MLGTDMTLTKLDIGAGARSEDGYLTLDVSPYFLPDLVADAARLPFKDGSFEAVRCYHVLEHIDRRKLVPTINEMWRVLRVGGIAEIEVPVYPHLEAVADPTHVSFLHSETFTYFLRCERKHDHAELSANPCVETQRLSYGIKPWKYAQHPLRIKGGAIVRVWMRKLEDDHVGD